MQEKAAALQILDARVQDLITAYEQLKTQNSELKESVVRLTHELHQKDTELTLLNNQKGAGETVHSITEEEKTKWKEDIADSIQMIEECMSMAENLK